MEHEVYIDWLFSVFGRLISAELELTSTIVFVDREFAKKKELVSSSQIAARVGEIKPHFTSEEVRGFVEELLEQGVLISTGHSLGTAH